MEHTLVSMARTSWAVAEWTPTYRRPCAHLQEAVRHLQEAVQVCDRGGWAMLRAVRPPQGQVQMVVMCTHACVCALMCLHVWVCAHVCACVGVHAWACMCMCVCVCARVRGPGPHPAHLYSRPVAKRENADLTLASASPPLGAPRGSPGPRGGGPPT